MKTIIIILCLTSLAVVGVVWAFHPFMIIYKGPSKAYYSAMKRSIPFRLVDIEPYIGKEIDEFNPNEWWEIREFKARLTLVLALYIVSMLMAFTIRGIIKTRDNKENALDAATASPSNL